MNTSTQAQDEIRETAIRDVKLYMANGWDLKEETPHYFLLKRNEASTAGHILVFIFTFWWTIGIGNLVYYLLSRKSKKVIK